MKPAKRLSKITSLLIFLILFSSGNRDPSFMLVLLPDLQTYTDAYPEILNSQTGWIANNAKDISFVIQQGDLTDNNSEQQ